MPLTLLQPENPPVDAGSRQPSRGVLRSLATAIGTPDGFHIHCKSRIGAVAWPWRRFGLDRAIAFADDETRLIVGGGTIQDANIVEGELGAVPGTDDRAILQRALG
jgi:hypothetical protein